MPKALDLEPKGGVAQLRMNRPDAHADARPTDGNGSSALWERDFRWIPPAVSSVARKPFCVGTRLAASCSGK